MGSVLRRTLLATVVVVALVGIVSALASAATKPAITFVSPSPAEGETLTTNAVEFKFTYNKKPNATKTLTCSLSGPTPKSGCDPAQPAAFGTKGSQSGASYSGLANGEYTFMVSLALTDGGTASATRSFTIDVPVPRHLYWANFTTGTIGRANVDGTGANQSFISGAINPWGVAVDAG